MNPDDIEEDGPQTDIATPRPVVRVRRGARSDRPYTVFGFVDRQTPPVSPAPTRPEIAALPRVVEDAAPAPPAPVTPPAPALSPEEQHLSDWLATPVVVTAADHIYQPVPVQLAEERRLGSTRRRRRVARQVRTQVLGTSAAMSLAIGGSAAAAIVLSQTDQVGGRLGIPAIGLFSPTATSVAEQQAAPTTKPARSTTTKRKPRKASSKPRKRTARRTARPTPSSAATRATRPPSGGTAQSTPQRTAPRPTRRPAPAARPQPRQTPKPQSRPRPTPPPPPPPPPPPSSSNPQTGQPALGTQPSLGG